MKIQMSQDYTDTRLHNMTIPKDNTTHTNFMNELLVECCQCGSFKRKGGEYFHTNQSLKIFLEQHFPISHGYCPECKKEFMKELDHLYKR